MEWKWGANIYDCITACIRFRYASPYANAHWIMDKR